MKIKKLSNLLKGNESGANRKIEPYDTQAEVKRIENGIAWVHIAGGVDETPVNLTINAKVGDTVQVRVGGGRAWLTGNKTAPPTDDTTANKAQTTATEAKYAADNATAEAVRAKDAADRAETSAQEAQTSAANALTSANQAKASATEANKQAVSATNSANNALTQLSTVESVVDTLTWIAEHSAFEPSTDTSVVASKTYYYPCNQILTLTSGTTTTNGLTFVTDANAGTVTVSGTATASTVYAVGQPDATAGTDIWFSGVNGGSSSTYQLRYSNGPGSTSINSGVGLSAIRSSGNLDINIFVASGYTANDVVFTPRVSTANEDFDYEIIENPTGNPSTQGYFELNTDDAVKTYVQTHLALTNDGLYVLNDSSAYKMLLANDGMYIQAPNGQTVNQSTANGNVIRSTNGTVIANLGYGSTEGESAISSAPYYTFGTRASGTIGSLSVAEGSGNIASGYCAHVEGVGNKDSTTAGGYGGNHVEGVGNTINTYGNTSHVEGQNNTTNVGVSHVEGVGNTVSYANVNDEATHVEGKGNAATGSSTHVEGEANTVTGNRNHIEGYNNTVSAIKSHVEGDSNSVFGATNHVEGYSNTMTSAYSSNYPSNSHIEGYYCKLHLNTDGGGDGLHAQNIGTIADGTGQTAIGRYNTHLDGGYTLTSKDGYALIIGNGTADNARSNALTVDWYGNVNIASGAKYKINGTNLSASDVGAVPTTRTVNSKALSSNITLSASDVGALATTGGTLSGTLTLSSHSSAIGTVKQAYAAAKSVASGSNTNLTSLSLEAGTWVVTGGVRFPNNATGYRRMNITTSSAAVNADVQLPALSGASTQLAYTLIVSLTSTTTYYLNCYHNAGTALSLVAGGGENGVNFIRAVRIA